MYLTDILKNIIKKNSKPQSLLQNIKLPEKRLLKY